MGYVNHRTVPVLVWVDVDEGIADMVRALNTIAGVRTHASCQGTRGEGGPAPYGPEVRVSWEDDDALLRLLMQFAVDVEGLNYGTAHPWPAVNGEEGAG